MAAEGTAPVETDKTGIGTGSHAIAGPLGAAIPGPPLALRRAIGAQPGARPGRGRGGRPGARAGRGRGRRPDAPAHSVAAPARGVADAPLVYSGSE